MGKAASKPSPCPAASGTRYRWYPQLRCSLACRICRIGVADKTSETVLRGKFGPAPRDLSALMRALPFVLASGVRSCRCCRDIVSGRIAGIARCGNSRNGRRGQIVGNGFSVANLCGRLRGRGRRRSDWARGWPPGGRSGPASPRPALTPFLTLFSALTYQ